MRKEFSLFVVVFGFVMLFLAHFLLVSQFKSLPSALYGGDTYYQHGVIEHIRQGSSPFVSSSMRNGLGGYLPLYPLLVSVFSILFKLNTDLGMIYFSHICFILGVAAWYVLGKRLFKDNITAMAVVLLTVMYSVFPIIKYTEFAYFNVLPIFLIVLNDFLIKKTKKSSFMLGLVLGLVSWTHGVLWVTSFLLANMFYVMHVYKSYHSKRLKLAVSNYLISFGTAFVFFVVAWNRLFINLHSLGVSKIMQWSVKGYFNTYEQAIGLIDDYFNALFALNGLSLKSLTVVLFLLGVYKLFCRDKSNELKLFFKTIFWSGLFFIFSFLLTVPLLGTHIAPDYCLKFWGGASMVLLSAYFIKDFTKKRKNIIVCLLIVFSVISIMDVIASGREGNIWFSNGLKKVDEELLLMQQYVNSNIGKNDVILSTKYLSFAINSLTGRKLVVNRWAHQGDPTQDFSRRDIDAAHILYGADNQLRLDLIKKYNVKYLYWNKYWNGSMFNYDRQGKIEDVADPFMAFYSKDLEEELSTNGLNFMRKMFYVDPAFRGEKFVKQDLLVVEPMEYLDKTCWSSQLGLLADEVWSYVDTNGHKSSIIYKLNLSDG